MFDSQESQKKTQIENRELKVDKEIASIIPNPAPFLREDEKAVNVNGEALPRGYKPHEAWLTELRESIAASKKPLVHVIVWKGKDIIIDGIARYKICRELGITPKIEEIELADKRAAIQERWRRNVQTLRNLADFILGEQVIRYWNKYLQPKWEENLKAHKGGRGKKVMNSRNRLMEQAKLARVGSTIMYHIQWILKYADRPFSDDPEAKEVRRMPNEEVKEHLRKLRNGTGVITTTQRSFKSFETRWLRKIKNKAARGAVVPAAPIKKGRSSSQKNKQVLRQSWTNESNVVVCGDAIETMRQFPNNTRGVGC